MRLGRFANLIVAACLTGVMPRAAAAALLAPPLFDPRGVRPQDVRQGTLGSCYIDSVIAALAARDPGLIRSSIQRNSDGTFTVRFPAGDTQLVFPGDVRYARRHGLDHSRALWVGVLLRAYAQQVELQALTTALRQSGWPWFLRRQAIALVRNSPLALEAYDHAIRDAVTQSGQVNPAALRQHWAAQAERLAVPGPIIQGMTSLLATAGFWRVLARSVRQNPEAYGAYRAVGNGGELTAAMTAFVGNARYIPVTEGMHLAALLTQAQAQGWVVTAGSRPVLNPTHAAMFAPWWVGSHAYSMLSFDPIHQMITLRNPWGRHPEPDGVQAMSLHDFSAAFLQIVIGKPGLVSVQ